MGRWPGLYGLMLGAPTGAPRSKSTMLMRGCAYAVGIHASQDELRTALFERLKPLGHLRTRR